MEGVKGGGDGFRGGGRKETSYKGTVEASPGGGREKG